MTVAQIEKVLPGEPLRTVENLPLPKVAEGKVRENFDAGNNELLIVATDRISAFDVVLPGGIPGKGILLTQLSLWWFQRTTAIAPNHLVDNHDRRVRELLPERPDLWPRSMLVRRLEPLPLEAVVRGYLAGSGFKEYRESGRLWDHSLPDGLVDSSRLPEPLFTPTTKAHEGHDEPVTAERAAEIVGAEVFAEIRRLSLELYGLGVLEAARAGILLADTKFEFGRDASGKLFLIDEVLTPDSSRYWPADQYEPGQSQPSYDKQIVRNYLDGLDWDKTPPGPQLPDEIAERTRTRYLELVKHLTGQN